MPTTTATNALPKWLPLLGGTGLSGVIKCFVEDLVVVVSIFSVWAPLCGRWDVTREISKTALFDVGSVVA